MRVLVTGANGMLGTDVVSALRSRSIEPIPTDVSGEMRRLDITCARDVREVLRETKPRTVIHCAAYTNVDRAETEPDLAYRINALGSLTVASACSDLDIPLCAVSTDFVFDGSKPEPYTEFDAPAPTSRYGASKLAGELCIQRVCRRYWIVRTSWLFGLNGKSFPDTILRLAESRPEIKVVADQHGSPTYTVDLAETIVQLIADPAPLYGVYHAANCGATTWHEFAARTVELAGLSGVNVSPIGSDEWPTPVKRPANSALRPLMLEMQGAYNMRAWEEALADFVHTRSALPRK